MEGVMENYNKALIIYINECNKRRAWGCEDAGHIYVLMERIQKGGLDKALHYFKKGCDMGSKESCKWMDICQKEYMVDGVPPME
jgi:hypothetical protein